MFEWRHYFFDWAVAGICLTLLAVLGYWAKDLGSRYRTLARSLIIVAGLVIASTALLSVRRFSDPAPNEVVVLLRVAGIGAACGIVYVFGLAWALRRVPAHTPGRRTAVKLAAASMAALPVAIGATAFIKRNEIRITEKDLQVPGLPPDLAGLRIVQITDIHLSPLVSESLLARAVDMANETRSALAVVTGDLVTRRGDPLDTCLRQLGRLRSDAGTFGCMGNHEFYADAVNYTEVKGRRLGLQFLRSESRTLRFGNSLLNIAGVDYQKMRRPYLTNSESLIVPGATNLLLSHNPDVFPIAADKGFDITIAGHTHGGQVNFEILHPALNIAHFYTPFIYGLYEIGPSRLYVSRGVGTIGVPARLGAPPEIAVLRLCDISS